MDVYGPSLPPRFGDAQSEHGSDPNHGSDHHSDQSKQTRTGVSATAKKHSDEQKHKVQAKYISQSSFSEEDQSSVNMKRSSKPPRAPSEQDQPHHDPDPLFYREVAIADLPSQYGKLRPSGTFLISLTPGKLCPGLPLLVWAWMTKKANRSSGQEALHLYSL